MKRSIYPSESSVQAAIVEWANATKMPYWENTKVGDFLLAIPNGGNRSITEALRLKKEGVKKGVSDLFLAITHTNNCGEEQYCGLWIEVKSKNGKLSKEQKEWMELMKMCEYSCRVVYSVDEGTQAIKDYLGMR